jgi:molybdenum cofactor cytidylyltransferase
MGAQKVLLPFGGKTVISHIVDELTASCVDEVHVVVGSQAEKVRAELSGQPVSILNNANYKSGMLSSVRCGLKAISQQCETALVALGDQPSVTTKLIDRMLEAFESIDERILVPLYRGKRGHPIVFSPQYRGEILAQYEGVGLRGLLYAHAEDVFELPVNTSGVLSDMDYPEDYRRELELLRKKSRGSV